MWSSQGQDCDTGDPSGALRSSRRQTPRTQQCEGDRDVSSGGGGGGGGGGRMLKIIIKCREVFRSMEHMLNFPRETSTLHNCLASFARRKREMNFLAKMTKKLRRRKRMVRWVHVLGEEGTEGGGCSSFLDTF